MNSFNKSRQFLTKLQHYGLSILFLLVFIPKIKADHSMGADLAYTCVNENTYNFVLTFYRDCSGIEAPSSVTVDINSNSCGLSSNAFLLMQGSPENVTPLCTTEYPNSTCDAGSFQGVEKYTYSGSFIFPEACDDWTISYSLCCRNENITNLVNPEDYILYVETTVNNIDAPCNNSPVFTTDPIPFICIGESFTYNHGVIEMDGDSLAFELVDPLNFQGDPIPFVAGLSASQPLVTAPANSLVFDNETGQFTLTPGAIQNGVIAILVNEYRNGILIGTTRRDMQLIVLNCFNQIPQSSSPTNVIGGTQFGQRFESCAGNTLAFDIIVEDQDNDDLLEILSNASQVLPGATVTTSGNNPLMVHFEWEIPIDYYGNQTFTITIKDDNCPYYGYQVLGFNVNVPGIEASTPDPIICLGQDQEVPLFANLISNNLVGTYSWTPTTGLSNPNIANPIATINSGITYTVTYTNPSCILSSSIEFFPEGEIQLEADQTSICRGEEVQLEASYTSLLPVPEAVCRLSSSACGDSPQVFNLGSGTSTTGTTANFVWSGSPYQGHSSDGRMQMLLLGSELTAMGIQPGLLTEIALEVALKFSWQPYNNFTIKMGCTDREDFQDIFFSPNLETVFQDNISSTLGWNTYNFQTPYEWDGTSNLIIEFCFDNTSFTGNDHVYVNTTTFNSVLFNRVDGNVGCNIPAVYSFFWRPNFRLGNCALASESPEITYDWTPANLVDNATIENPTTTPDSSGFYHLTLSTTRCNYSDSIYIEVNDLKISYEADTLSCNTVKGSATVNILGGNPPYVINWSTGSTDAIATGLTVGTYAVTVVDAAHCQQEQEVIIPIGDPLNIVSVKKDVKCFGANDGQINVLGSGGTGGLSYTWSHSALETGPLVSGLAPGVYKVTASDAFGCETATSIEIEEPLILSALATPTAIECFGGEEGKIILDVAGGVPPYSFYWDNEAGTDQNPNNLESDLYTVTVTDFNDCQLITSAEVEEPEDINIIETINQANCFGTGTGSIDLTVTGGNGNYTYQWGHTSNNTSMVSELNAGVYEVIVSDQFSCSQSSTFTILEPGAIQGELVDFVLDCNGDTNGYLKPTLQGGTPPYVYYWDNGETTNELTGLANGNYALTIEDANGCSLLIAGEVIEPEVLTHQLTTQENNCFGETLASITVDVQGGTMPYSYVWNTGQSTSSISSLPNGFYEVTVNDQNGCSFVTQTTINSPQSIEINSNVQNVSCAGGNDGRIEVFVAGGLGNYTYTWNDNTLVGASLTNLSEGFYDLTVTDENGCTLTNNMQIVAPNPLTIQSELITDLVCNASTTGSATVEVLGGTAPYTYLWDNGSTNNSALALDAGIHTLTITDFNSCIMIHSLTINEPEPLDLTGSISPLSCFENNTGAIDLVINGGTPPYTYLWNNGNTTEDLLSINAGEYQVTATDANGCTFESNFVITEPTSIEVAINTTSATCAGYSDGSATMTTSGGTAPYEYLWSNGSTTSTIANLAPGNYWVTISDQNGCDLVEAIDIIGQEEIQIDQIETQAVYCWEASTGSALINVSGGTPPYTYLWSNGVTSNNNTGLETGAYSVIITDANNCQLLSESIEISGPNAGLTLEASISNPSCEEANGSIQVLVNGGTGFYSFLWENGTTNQSLSDLPMGNYALQITDDLGCSIDTIFELIAAEPLAFVLNGNAPLCFGETNGSIETLNISGGESPYLFSLNGSPFSPIGEFNDLSEGNYVVTIQDALGCEWSQSILLEDPPLFQIEMDEEWTISQGESRVLEANTNSTGPVDYIWSPDVGLSCTNCPNPIASPLNTVSYTLQATNANGCVDYAEFELHVQGRDIFIPNAFSPNEDGANDHFIIHGPTDFAKIKLLRIYDRWGELVFENQDFKLNKFASGWDGTFKGEPMNPGNYTYYLEVDYADGRDELITGSILLIR